MSDAAKRAVAEAAAALVEPGMRVGLGSGSTAREFVRALGRRVADGLHLEPAVATSEGTAQTARACDIALADMLAEDAPVSLDLAADGADEVDGALRLLKGGGASLLREKIAARMAARFVVIVDRSKLVETLGAFPLPVEVVPFGVAATAARVAERVGVRPMLRRRDDGRPLLTDNGNLLLDCPMQRIDDPAALAGVLAAIPGVVEHGLFLEEAHEVLIAGPDGIERRTAHR